MRQVPHAGPARAARGPLSGGRHGAPPGVRAEARKAKGNTGLHHYLWPRPERARARLRIMDAYLSYT